MSKKLLCIVLLLTGLAHGCYQAEETEADDSSEEMTGSGGAGGTEVKPPDDTNKGQNPSEYEEEDFDPCPEVAYVLWEDDQGRKIIVVIEVFCDPMRYINMGCPPPAL